jgi:hypothetical protein
VISLLIYILVTALILALIWYVLTLLPLAPQPRMIVFLIICLIVVLGFLRQYGVLRV